MTIFDQGRSLLWVHGADRIEHPGGTLYEHLNRVQNQLQEWDASVTVQAAGLCHAAYGTDGFAPALLELSERRVLAHAVGADVERLVYLYASCDRAAVYPRLGQAVPVVFTDRFTATSATLGEAELRAFLEITAANELDVLTHNPALAAQHSAGLLDLFTRARDLLSPLAHNACESTLRPLTVPQQR